MPLYLPIPETKTNVIIDTRRLTSWFISSVSKGVTRIVSKWRYTNVPFSKSPQPSLGLCLHADRIHTGHIYRALAIHPGRSPANVSASRDLGCRTRGLHQPRTNFDAG